MIAQPILTKTQRYCLTFTLTLILTLTWTTLARADSPGDPDITFGGTGIVTDSISSGSDGGWSVAIQPDDKIVVAGVSDSGGSDPFNTNSTNDAFAVIRYNSDGSRDTTFNNTGVVTTPINDASWGFDTAIQPDGKIVVVGNSGRLIEPGVFDYAFAVARYNITGTLDTNFNSTGIVTTSILIGVGFERGWSVALQPDGKIVVAGEYEDLNSMFNDIVVVRYNITGTLDTDFNETGILTTSLVSGGGTDVAVQPDGKIVVANYRLVRFTSTGALDTTFNGTGMVTTPGFSAGSLALQTNGKIVVAGNSGGDFAVARFNNNGTLDTSFNSTGIVTTAITSDSDWANDLALQPNGKIVLAGTSGFTTGDEGDIAVVRYNNDGSLDTTFGNTGVVTTPISNNWDAAWGIAIQSDGKIVAAGYSDGAAPNTTFAVARYIGDSPVTLAKTVDNDTPNPGQLITYTLSISNSGSFSTTNLLISDTLPLSLTLAESVTLEPPQLGAILATSALSLPTVASSITINPMTSITVTIPVMVSTELAAGLHLTNTATITSPEMSILVTDTVAISIATIIVDPGFDLYLPVILKKQ